MQPAARLSLVAGTEAVRLARRIGEEAAGRRTGEDLAACPELAALRGAFVTLHRGGTLRGCIGVIDARRPLRDVIAEIAPAAARDPRFPPVRAAEWDAITVELSVLSPPWRAQAAPHELEALVRIGEHGLIVADRARKALLLPQVAVEHGFGPARFLSTACVKAGLPPDAWRDAGRGLEWSLFLAQVFRETAPRGEVVERPVAPTASRPEVP